MKAAKIVATVVVAYLGVVVAFESLIGFFQPADETTLVITTVDRDGPALNVSSPQRASNAPQKRRQAQHGRLVRYQVRCAGWHR